MVELHLFGGVCLSEEGSWDPHPLLSRPKCLALLGFLAAASPRGCHRRDKLMALLWPDSDERHARGSLRKALFLVRQEAGDGCLCGCGCEDVGVDFGRVWCDVAAFRDAMEAGDLEVALGHYGGDLMDGFHLGEWTFDEWVAEERKELRTMAAGAGWELASEEEERGMGMAAARWARRAAGFTPFDEMAHRRLLRTLNRLGDRAGALREHDEFRERLESELQLSPAPETLALVDEIRGRNGVGTASSRPGEGAAAGNGRAARNGNGNGKEKGSVAVLPFMSLTDDAESQEFADRLHREVIARLGSGGRLRVAPRARVMQYRGFPKDLHGVAEEMGVDTVLEGSVRSWNGRVRIALDLVGGGGRGSLWCHVLEREMEDHGTLRDRVADEVAREVGDRLGGA